MKKDDMLEITIEDISSDGSGVGKADGFALFVKDTIPGDQVKVKIMKMKKRYGYARLMEILVPSPDRIQAPCPVARHTTDSAADVRSSRCLMNVSLPLKKTKSATI